MAHEETKTEVKYLSLKNCKNMQHIEHTKLYECVGVSIIETEILREHLRVFSDQLKSLMIKRTMSVDAIVTKWLAFESPFKNLVVLDLSQN